MRGLSEQGTASAPESAPAPSGWIQLTGRYRRLVGLACDVGLALVVLVAADRYDQDLDLPLGFLMALSMFVRRRFPVTVLAAVLALATVQFVLEGAPDTPLASAPAAYDAAVLFAMMSVVHHSRDPRMPYVAGGAVLLVTGAGTVGLPGTALEPFLVPEDLLYFWGLTLTVWLTAFSLRTRRLYAESQAARAWHAEREQEQRMRLAAAEERAGIARELHDVVAHHVTGIVVQAQAARMMGAQNPRLALETLGRIEEAGADALTAMRRLVRSMRSHAEDTEQATTDLAADLRRLVEAGHHGVRTEVDLRLPGAVPHEVGRSALRLVQESLTNVGKHAIGATCVRVMAEIVGVELHLEVQNDGTAGTPPPGEGLGSWRSGGYGLVGMRERVELLHGRFSAGPIPGGWLVEAWLPLEASATE